MSTNLLAILVIVLLFFGMSDLRAWGQAKTESQIEPAIKVEPGALEGERKDLLARIYSAARAGVGIKNYLIAFESIEQLVKSNSSEEKIRERMVLLNDALYDQVAPLQYKRLRTKEKLTLDEAREYVVVLINADRAKYQLQPVVLDSIASKAGQAHTDEMARLNYCAHWDVSGKKPWQRYTEVGGVCSVWENLALHPVDHKMAEDQLFSAESLEKIQFSFMSEKPPDDGHRLQILGPHHNKVGIGLCQRKSDATFAQIALAQEFVNEYGEYAQIPTKISPGKAFVVSGSLIPGWKVASVEVCSESLPRPMTRGELNKTHSCRLSLTPITKFYADEEPAAMKTWTKENKLHFAVTVTPKKDWKDGLYYIMIWTLGPETDQQILASVRTCELKRTVQGKP